MLPRSLGSEDWPPTVEARLPRLLPSLCGVAVFGYVTAGFASFFVRRDAAAQTVGAADVKARRDQIAMLRRDLPAR